MPEAERRVVAEAETEAEIEVGGVFAVMVRRSEVAAGRLSLGGGGELS